LNNLFKDVSLATRRDMRYLYNEVPPHCSTVVTNQLGNFKETWIGRYRPILWPLWPPD
jgi:hypothetical protein